MTVFDHLTERTNDTRFVFEIHGQIGFVPFAKNPQAFKVLALSVDLFECIRTAACAESGFVDVFSGLAYIGFNLVFDWQTMAVPARNIRRVIAVELSAFDNHVLDDFVDCVADVDFTIGVGRAIVQNECLFPVCRCGTNLFIQIHLLPAREHFGFALGQISTHREIGLGKVQSCFVVTHLESRIFALMCIQLA